MNRREFLSGLGLGLIGCKDELMDIKKINWWTGANFVDNSVPFGEIFNDNFARASLGSDYLTPNADITVSLDGSKMNLTGGTTFGVFKHRVQRNYYQNFETWTQSVTFTLNAAPSATTYGLGIGIKTSATNSDDYWNWCVYLNMSTDATYGGKLILYSNRGVSITLPEVVTESSTKLTPTNGRSYTITFTKSRGVGGATYSAVGLDNTTLATNTLTWTEDVSVPGGGTAYYAEKACTPCLYRGNVNTSVTNWTFSSQERQNVPNLFVGDSITHGLNATNLAGRFANQCGFTLGTTYQVCAGPSNHTNDVIRMLDHINSYNANRVFLFIGRNDVARARTMATIQSEYISIVQSIRDAGASVVHFYMLDDQGDEGTWNSFLTSSYSSVDTIINARTGMTFSSDAVHPNQSGHNLVASTILANI